MDAICETFIYTYPCSYSHEIIEREAEIVAQARASGELTDQQIKELDELEEFDKSHEARIDVIRAGMACVVRR